MLNNRLVGALALWASTCNALLPTTPLTSTQQRVSCHRGRSVPPCCVASKPVDSAATADKHSGPAARSAAPPRRRPPGKPSTTVGPSLQQLNRAIEAAGVRGDLYGVIRALERVEQQSRPNVFTLNTVINACLRCRCEDEVIDEMWARLTTGSQRPVVPNTVSYNTLLKRHMRPSSSSSREATVTAALQLSDAMRAAGVPLDAVTYNTLLHICAVAGDLARAEAVLQQMAAAGVSATPYTLTALLKGYSAADEPERAFECFTSMSRNGVRPNAVAYSVLAGVCLDHGMPERAVEVLLVTAFPFMLLYVCGLLESSVLFYMALPVSILAPAVVALPQAVSPYSAFCAELVHSFTSIM
jgi:pentatricopeptide repeat protein